MSIKPTSRSKVYCLFFILCVSLFKSHTAIYPVRLYVVASLISLQVWHSFLHKNHAIQYITYSSAHWPFSSLPIPQGYTNNTCNVIFITQLGIDPAVLAKQVLTKKRRKKWRKKRRKRCVRVQVLFCWPKIQYFLLSSHCRGRGRRKKKKVIGNQKGDNNVIGSMSANRWTLRIPHLHCTAGNSHRLFRWNGGERCKGDAFQHRHMTLQHIISFPFTLFSFLQCTSSLDRRTFCVVRNDWLLEKRKWDL